MFAVSFDFNVSDLKKYYGDPYHKAYFEIRNIMLKHGFTWIQGSTYVTKKDDMSVLFDLIKELSQTEWISKSIRDIRAFEMKNWSNFTKQVRND